MLPRKTGLVARGNDIDDFVAVVEEMLADPQRCKAMGQEARHYMEARSFDAAFLETWETYKQIQTGERFQWVSGF
jgi:hypothetical protein